MCVKLLDKVVLLICLLNVLALLWQKTITTETIGTCAFNLSKVHFDIQH